ncbi:alginate lyase [Rubellimicrobium rubrum]|uniref:Alginate lyase n=1 Tax=Rubellimicrobium rubrum TaxID=2585369 RepID=A0A5C4N0S1_9RHOB|nr:alginate lyase family protein [Rubellimicrobium rubrum]TNC50856.1 alginate lyase [Rubellimicrobium rubrum]
MTPNSVTTLSLVTGLSLLVGLPAVAQDAGKAEGFTCPAVPDPVVTLEYGSRYTAESEDRSDLDAETNAEVDRALGPVDDFIIDLANAANRAEEGGEDAVLAADCVVDAVAVWAEANALSDLGSMNAEISTPSRLGGIALAYLQARPHAAQSDDAQQTVIEDWLQERMLSTMAYFDNEAPERASQNNLRAWAGLAAAAVGTATSNGDITGWAADTVELVACQADSDGALPLEMARGPRALQYQLHATAPLVVGAALLSEAGADLFAACDGAIHRIVNFVPQAFEDPDLVAEKAGETQTYFDGEDELEGWELAWAEAYLSKFDSPALAGMVEEFRPLANSKLGGAQDLFW